MRRADGLFLWLLLLCSLCLVACEKEEGEVVYYHNNPLPVGQRRLNMLAIGNSYAANATQHLGCLLTAAGIADSACAVYLADFSGASLSDWWNIAQEGIVLKLTWRAGHKMPVESGTLAEILAQDWDVITLQQNSSNSASFSTFNPSLQHLIEFIQSQCTNPRVALAWHLTWSYADGYEANETAIERWRRICNTAQHMTTANGIDILIPSGTAIQNARATTLNTQGQLTIDGSHLDRGVGCYVAASCYFETLFAPVFETTVLGNMATYSLPVDRFADDLYPSTPVTDENRELCQRCAVAAVASPFEVAF